MGTVLKDGDDNLKYTGLLLLPDQEKTCIIYGNHTTEKSFSRKCKKYENNKETIQTKQARIQYKKNIPGGGIESAAPVRL